MSRQPAPYRFTVQALHRMAEAGVLDAGRVELVDGRLLDLPPPGAAHAARVARVLEVLVRLGLEPDALRSGSRLYLDAYSELLPDLVVLRPGAGANAAVTAADVVAVVEVAEGAPEYEREIKLPLYAAAAVGEVWIVDADGGRVAAYWLPEDGRYGSTLGAAPGQLLASPLLGGRRLDVREILG